MNVFGVVAEYNPFHTGHGYLLEQTRRQLGADSAAVAVMSGNWTQQAQCAVADKWIRARLALMGGVDLVLELPTVWAVSSAQSFARGAVSLLHACGVVDTLSFGSESANLGALAEAAACLDSEDYSRALRRQLDGGGSFASCRQAAVRALAGAAVGDLLAAPNNNLGVEYLRSLRALHSSITPMTILRQGAAHNETCVQTSRFLSASHLRAELAKGNWEPALRFMPQGGAAILQGAPRPDPARLERAVLARLRSMTAQDWALLPDSGAAEGLPQRLARAGHSCTSLEDFFTMAKTKRYARARLARLVLWAYLGLQVSDVPETPPYLRVLGLSDRGRHLLSSMRKRAALPVITKPAHARKLDETCQRLLALECRCTDLYDLCFDPIPLPGREWREGPVVYSGVRPE